MTSSSFADKCSTESICLFFCVCELRQWVLQYSPSPFELHAVHLPLKLISQSKKQSFLVLPDFLSVLKLIANLKCDYLLSVELLNVYSRLICDNKDIVFAWVSGHVVIRRNSVVDLEAKRALEKPVNKRMMVPYSDFKVLTNRYTKKLWQTEWERYPVV